jgi:hypothetical protein
MNVERFFGSVVVLTSFLLIGQIATHAGCDQKCNEGDCWKVDGTYWHASDDTCCSGHGSWADNPEGGTKQGSGTIPYYKNDSNGDVECPGKKNNRGKEDSRASCNGEDDMEVVQNWDDCSCSGT